MYEMLKINIQTKDGDQFEWEGSAEEARHIWDKSEEVAQDHGFDSGDSAAAAISAIIAGQPEVDEVMVRSRAFWAVYAVLRIAANTRMTDGAEGRPTIFDLAEDQTIKATIRPNADETGVTFIVISENSKCA